MIDVALFIAALIGLAAGGFLVARSPTFWVGMAIVVWLRVRPLLLARMPPEDEQKLQDAYRRGEDVSKLWRELKKKRQKSNSST